jgi:cystathionine gamma-synthase
VADLPFTLNHSRVSLRIISMKIETKAVHAGAGRDPVTGAIAAPIHLSTTFEHGPASEEIHGYTYIRDKNPTQDRLETAMSELEGGESALVFSSGMGAATALLQHLEPGSHVIFPADVYIHVRVAHREFLPKWGIEVSVVDMRSVDAAKRALRPNTKLIWLETPSNPLMEVTDIAAVSAIAHEAGAVVAVDNTFATPVLQRPFEWGADVILHSTTKFCGGHSDVQGGCLVFKKRVQLYEKLLNVRTVLGAVGSPFNSWLVLRGLRTLACRMERHSANGLAVAKALAQSRNIEKVFYPGLPSHPGHDIAARQMSGFGGMLSILVKGGWDEAVGVASRVKLFQNATSLGGVESLIEHRASAEGKSSTIPKNLLRLSVGLEHPDDLAADLLQALGD